MAELGLRKKMQELEERAHELDLEVARRLDAEMQRLEASLHRTIGEEQALKVRGKDKQIEDLKKLVDEMKRNSEQGSQACQGEVRGFMGATLTDIPALTLDGVARLMEGAR